jgi:hypothetical protein
MQASFHTERLEQRSSRRMGKQIPMAAQSCLPVSNHETRGRPTARGLGAALQSTRQTSMSCVLCDPVGATIAQR